MHSAYATNVAIELQSNGTSKVDGTTSTDYSTTTWVCMDGKGDLTGKSFTITSVDTLSCGESGVTYGINIGGNTAFSASVSSINAKCHYGISLWSSGTNNITGITSITVTPSSGFASGIYTEDGTKSITFNGSGSFIKATSSNSYVQGVSLTYKGKAKVSNLENITVETTGTDSGSTARGINLGNGNTAGASDPEFSVSFVTTGGSISAYSAQGESCGIRFGDGSIIAKSEVLNVKTITAGVKSGSTDSAGTAYGIYAKASINKVTFTGAGSSITAKSSGDDAYGIGASVTGTTTVTNLGNITAKTTGASKFAIGISSTGTDTNFANNVSFKGNGGQAITATAVTTANAYSIYAMGKGATTVSFESSILSGKVYQNGSATLTLNFNNGGVWNYVKDDVTGNVSVNVNNGGTIVFDLPATTAANDTIFTTTGTVTIADTGTIRVINGKATQLQEGDEICLIDNGANITLGSNVTKQHSSDGITWSEAEIYLKQDDAKKLMYKRTKMGLDPDGSKAPVEGMAAAAASVNTSSDLVTGAGMANMITSTAAAGGGAEPFAAASFGSSRLETGSHVDSKGYGIVVGVGKKVFNKAGNKTTGGIFVEYGNSDTDTYNNAVTGSGKSINKGVGYMMRYDHTSGNYYEGMIHAGKINSSWSNSTGGYSMSPTYFGGALTYGHKFMVAEDRQLSVYGSYIYGRTGGGDAKIAGYDYSFGATNSHRTKVGVRYAMSDLMDTKKFRPYIGLAWEREYKGDTVATVRGFGEAPSPSMKGNSGILEIGCKQEVGKWTLGIGAEVFTGKRKGWNGTLQATYNF